MKEVLELRINYDYAHLLFKAEEGKNLGTSVKIVQLSKDDPRHEQIPIVAKEIKRKYNRGFFFAWEIKRKYSEKELVNAALLHMKIRTTFEPAGEECGTLYDETVACEICGANRKQVGPLRLKELSIPKKDIARTIAGEVVVSEKFVTAYKQRDMKGAFFNPIFLKKGNSNYDQLIALSEIELSNNTLAGIDPYDFSESSEGVKFTIPNEHDIKIEREIYKCPKGHTIGLNLLSEPFVQFSPLIGDYDFFASKQKIGVKRGLLRPEPIYFCSLAFRKMIEEEKLTGFQFEIANVG